MSAPSHWLVTGVVFFALAGVACSGATRASAPSASPSLLKVDGQLDPRVVQTVIAANTGEVNACYREYLATHPSTEGKLVLHWAVKDDGSVAETCQGEGTTVPDELGRCVSERVASWRFPPSAYTQKAQVEYTFDFVARRP